MYIYRYNTNKYIYIYNIIFYVCNVRVCACLPLSLPLSIPLVYLPAIVQYFLISFWLAVSTGFRETGAERRAERGEKGGGGSEENTGTSTTTTTTTTNNNNPSLTP